MKHNTFTQHSAIYFSKLMSRSAAIGLLSVGLSTSLAWAQDEASSADIAAARELAIEGMKLADAGHCAQAIDKLYRAEKLRHSPIVLGRLGECQIAEGKIVDGTEDLQRVLHEPLSANPSANLLRARERAQAALDSAKPKVAMLTISVRGPTENITVTVDGQSVPSVLLERDRPTDPGDHVVEAAAPGYIKASRRLSIGAGEKQEVMLKLRIDPQAAAKPAPESVTSNGPTAPTTGQAPSTQVVIPTSVDSTPMPESRPYRTASYVLWAVGGAAVASGGLFGFLALNDKKNLDKDCPNNACPPSSQSTLDGANRYATVSTILVAVGGAGLALGTVLYFTAGSSSKTEHRTTSFMPHAFVGLGKVGVQGVF